MNTFKNNNLLKPSVNIKNNKNELDNNHCNQINQDYSSEYSYKDNKIPEIKLIDKKTKNNITK